jgi:hypothetical protein
LLSSFTKAIKTAVALKALEGLLMDAPKKI